MIESPSENNDSVSAENSADTESPVGTESPAGAEDTASTKDAANTDSAPDNHIEVNVSTHYIEEQSQPEEDRYVFSYTITLHNTGGQPARLMTRHWIINDANGNTQEVHGEGVVGEHPYLRPGESFEYTSGTVLETPVGCMQGSYQMVSDAGQPFDATIPAFTLSLPHALH